MTHPPRPERLLHRVMRHAGGVAAAVLALALVLGLVRMAADVEEEVEAAVGLALVMAELGRLQAAAPTPEAGQAALDGLLRLQQSRPLRHLRLQVRDGAGRLLLPADPGAGESGALAWLGRWWAAVGGGATPAPVSWTLPRPGGAHWTVTLTASAEAERREALGSLLESLAVLAAMVAGLLLAMRANLRRALAPLDRLVAAIGGIERSDTAPVQALPPMPVVELDALAGALRHLGAALDAAETDRRRLAQQVLGLQEDERARLARELHDEFGQRLTALRVDAAWLARRLGGLTAPAGPAPAGGPAPPVQVAAGGALTRLAEAAEVARGMADQCGLIQQDIRQLLVRLQPFGPEAAAAVPPRQLAQLLEGLVQAWSGPAADGLGWQLALHWRTADGPADQPWSALPDGLALEPALALALYRISQEAMTNVARHAGAREATLALRLDGAARPGAALTVDWAVEDDGRGLDDAAAADRRGNGLAGLRERVWALGGQLQIGPATAASAADGRPGCRLAARLPGRWYTPSGAGAGAGPGAPAQ